MIKVFYFGIGDVPKKAYQNFKNIHNLKIYWGFNPAWDKDWSIDEIQHPKDLVRDGDELYEISSSDKLNSVLEEIKPDIGLVVGSYWIFKKEFFSKFRLGVYNYHPSDLPLFRGSGGITWQILHNQKETCVTIHQMNEEIDTGKIVIKNKKFVNEKPKLEEFLQTMKELSVETIVEFMDKINDEIEFSEISTDEKIGNYFPRLDSKINGAINWMWEGEEIEIFIRAFAKPYSGAFTFLGKNKINIFQSKFKKGIEYHPYAFGLIISKNKKDIKISVRGGELTIPLKEITSEQNIEKSIRLGSRLWTPYDIIDESMAYRPFSK